MPSHTTALAKIIRGWSARLTPAGINKNPTSPQKSRNRESPKNDFLAFNSGILLSFVIITLHSHRLIRAIELLKYLKLYTG
jgi:hypothetical protein